MNNEALKIVQTDSREIIKNLGRRVEQFAGKTILITGANGVVGSYFAHTIAVLNDDKYLKKPIQCICLTRHKVSSKSRTGHLLKKPYMHFVTADVTKKFKLPFRPDYIIHSASYASPKSYLAKPVETLEANSTGTKNLLDLALKYQSKMMFISTGSVYGDAKKGDTKFTEEHTGNVSPLDTRAVYSESKRFGETYCSIYAHFFNVQVTIARLSNMFGPGFKLDDGRAIPDFFNQAFYKNKIEINGDPKTSRAYLYISDAILGMWMVLDGKKGEAYNVSSEKEYKMIDIASELSKLFKGCMVSIKKDAAKQYLKGSPVHAIISSKKLQKESSWRPRISLTEGLKRLQLWYKAEYSL